MIMLVTTGYSKPLVNIKRPPFLQLQITYGNRFTVPKSQSNRIIEELNLNLHIIALRTILTMLVYSPKRRTINI